MHVFVFTRACVKIRVCSPMASSLMCVPTFWLSVKPLHCSTASGISVGILFPSPFLPLSPAVLTIERLNLGQIPPARKALRSHMHIFQCSYATLQRPGAAESPQKYPVATVVESHVSWRQTWREREEKSAGLSGVQQFKHCLRSCVVVFWKKWKGCGVFVLRFLFSLLFGLHVITN